MDRLDPLRRAVSGRRLVPGSLRKGVYVVPNLITTAGLFAGFYSVIASCRRWICTSLKLKYRKLLIISPASAYTINRTIRCRCAPPHTAEVIVQQHRRHDHFRCGRNR